MSWRMQFFQPPKQGIPEYAKDGLVLWFDAIWNKAEGEHEGGTPYIANIAPPESRSVCDSIKAVGHYVLQEDGISICRGADGVAYPDGGLMWQNAYTGLPATERTLEICMSDLRPNAGGVRSINNAWTAFPYVYFSPESPRRISVNMSGFEKTLDLDLLPANDYFLNPLQYSIRTGNGYGCSVETNVNSHGVHSANTVKTTHPGMAMDNFTNENIPLFRWNNGYSNCIFHALRLYNRKLTDEEVVNNYIADKQRFGL